MMSHGRRLSDKQGVVFRQTVVIGLRDEVNVETRALSGCCETLKRRLIGRSGRVVIIDQNSEVVRRLFCARAFVVTTAKIGSGGFLDKEEMRFRNILGRNRRDAL